MNRRSRKQLEATTHWTREQDSYLIENHLLTFAELRIKLPFTDDQIIQRKKLLGLLRRERQLRRI
ncbi:acyl-CoA thioesterase [Acinetobacter sp. ANC 4779]|nr:acyl-CoA thioesterase [Acinetobacter sp. ANC 4779]